MTTNDLTSTDTAQTADTAQNAETAQTTEAVKNPCEREVFVEIPAEEVTREWNDVVASFQKQAHIPGFRKGKVPASLIRNKFAEEIKSTVTEKLVPNAFRQEAEKQNLTPISQPQVIDLELEYEKPLRFKGVFEVLPSFDVTGYKEIKVEQNSNEITDEVVEKEIDKTREECALYLEITEDRGAADGDFVSMSLKRQEVGSTAEPFQMEEVAVEIGSAHSDDTLLGLSNNLRGAKKGEKKSFDITFAEDSSDKAMAGKTMHFDIEIKAIKNKHVPELTDEWVKELGYEELQSVDELRAHAHKELENERKRKGKDEVLSQLTAKFPIDVPTALVEKAIDLCLEHGLRSMIRRGMRPEDIKKLDLTPLREAQRVRATRDVRANLLLEKIADLEAIEISDEDLEKDISAAAQLSGQDVAEYRKSLEEKDGITNLRRQKRADRALDLLYKQSIS